MQKAEDRENPPFLPKHPSAEPICFQDFLAAATEIWGFLFRVMLGVGASLLVLFFVVTFPLWFPILFLVRHRRCGRGAVDGAVRLVMDDVSPVCHAMPEETGENISVTGIREDGSPIVERPKSFAEGRPEVYDCAVCGQPVVLGAREKMSEGEKICRDCQMRVDAGVQLNEPKGRGCDDLQAGYCVDCDLKDTDGCRVEEYRRLAETEGSTT